MTQYLPPNLLALFAPREPIPYFAPLDKLPWEKKPWLYTGVSQCLGEFEDPSETPPPTRAETKEERVVRKRQQREERHREKLESSIGNCSRYKKALPSSAERTWEPTNDPNVQGDPFKTLFVGRINYDTSESKLRREFEQYGPIKRIHMVVNTKTSKPRGYAFLEYEKERDMHAAYKYADGKKIDSKRVVVDVERGRTVKSWRPRRLGGGLGGTRRGAPHENIKYSGRVDERDMERNDGARERENDRDRDRDRDRERDRERRRERSREREREKRPRSRSRDRERRRRRSRSRDRERDRRNRSRSREHDRNRKDRDKERDKERDRDKERSRDKEKEKGSRKDKDKDHDKKREGEKERDKDKNREKDKEKDRNRDKDREKDRKDRDKDRKRGRENEEKDREREEGERNQKRLREERSSGSKDPSPEVKSTNGEAAVTA